MCGSRTTLYCIIYPRCICEYMDRSCRYGNNILFRIFYRQFRLLCDSIQYSYVITNRYKIVEYGQLNQQINSLLIPSKFHLFFSGFFFIINVNMIHQNVLNEYIIHNKSWNWNYITLTDKSLCSIANNSICLCIFYG